MKNTSEEIIFRIIGMHTNLTKKKNLFDNFILPIVVPPFNAYKLTLTMLSATRCNRSKQLLYLVALGREDSLF